jgi:capsular exopolysaccharide synthesis family protein
MNELTTIPDHQPDLPPEAGHSAAPKFRLQKFLLFLTKYWWVPTATVLVSLAVSAALVLHKPASFVSRGSMWETVKLRLPEGDLFSEDVANFVGTQSDLLQSAMLRNRVLNTLRAASNSVVIPVDPNGEPLPVSIRVSQATKSAVFELDATGPQAAYTQAYLEALMQAYLDYKGEIRKEISGDTLASITGQVQLAEQELKNQQDILTDFQRTNNMAILQEEGTVAGGYLTKLKTQLSDLQLDDQLLEAASAELTGGGPGTNQTNQVSLAMDNLASQSGSGAAGGVSTALQDTIKELELLKIKQADLSTNLRPMHPKMVQLNADIERDEKEVALYRQQSRDQLASSRETTRLKMENVQNSIKEWEARVVEANSRIADAERLKINVQRAQGEYDQLATLVQNVKISRNIDQEDLAILEHASPAVRSHNADKKSLESAVVGGLALGLGFIALLAIRDEKFGSVHEVNEKLGDAVIAQVPELPGLNGKLPLLENGGPSHIYAESYRCLRSALLFLASEAERPRLLLITSALPDEGKSTVAANLARTLALGGARVLLVDADLRRGHLHHLLGLEQQPGLSHLLSVPADADKVFQTNSLPNLWFIGCGERLNNPGDQFLGPALDQLLSRWRSQFDYVLVDSSPIFAADDATTLAPKMDGTLLVIRSRFSSARQVRGALDMLYQRRARVLGVVFNRADATSRSYDYYKYASYHPGADSAVAKTG